VLDWLESTPLALWLRESPSIWSSATVLTLHTTGMAVLVGSSWVLDLRLLGISRRTPLRSFRWVFTAIGVGLALNLVTGVLLFVKNATTWGTSLAFLVKMSLVIASVATLIPLRQYVMADAADERPSAAARGVPSNIDATGVSSRARLLAIASIFAWAGAVTAGRLLAYLAV
jgi:hypothetical protein